MSIGARLIILRKILDINQSEMAMVMGCTQGTVSLYEKDGTTMSVKCLSPLRKAYNVNLDWLLHGVGEMFMSDTYNQQSTENQPPVEVKNKKKDKLLKEIYRLSAEMQHILQELQEYL